MHLKLHSDMKKMPTISYVSIRRQGRVLFLVKAPAPVLQKALQTIPLSTQFCQHIFHCWLPTARQAAFLCPESLDSSTLEQQQESPSQETQLAALLSARSSETSGAKNPGVMNTRSCSHHRHRGGPRIQPRAVAVCSENVSLHSIRFVNRARSSCTKYCNDSD